MTAYAADVIPVFGGPSLSGWQAQAPFALRPPAAALDLLGLIAGPPCTVVLIDGVFDARRSVWHKEILHLMARGFRVIGAASMGALRAAELAPFGMIGVGAIYEAYVGGRITADDEVAVVHAPPDYGCAPLTVAQVDVRAALVRAVRAGIVPVDAARALRRAGAAIHYRDRSWSEVIAAGDAQGLALDGLADWLERNPRSQKAVDARQALALATDLAPRAPRPTPEPPITDFLRVAAASIGVSLGADAPPPWA